MSRTNANNAETAFINHLKVNVKSDVSFDNLPLEERIAIIAKRRANKKAKETKETKHVETKVRFIQTSRNFKAN